MPSYRTVDADTIGLLTDAMREYRPDLVEVDVRIQILGALAKRGKEGQPKGPALKKNGYPCLALASIFNLEDRVGGSADCRILLDMDQFPDLPHEKKMSTLHHELLHYELVRDSDGAVTLDDANRPKIKSRPHDFECGMFRETIVAHGVNAMETAQFTAVRNFYKQQTFAWGDAE